MEANSVINSEAVRKDASVICARAVANHKSVENEFCQIDCNTVVGVRAEVPKGHKVESCTFYKKIEAPREYKNESFF